MSNMDEISKLIAENLRLIEEERNRPVTRGEMEDYVKQQLENEKNLVNR